MKIQGRALGAQKALLVSCMLFLHLHLPFNSNAHPLLQGDARDHKSNGLMAAFTSTGMDQDTSRHAPSTAPNDSSSIPAALRQATRDGSRLPIALLINQGEAYTRSTSIQLQLTAPGAVAMKIANQPDLSDGAWEPFSPTKPWNLPSEFGDHSVFCQFRYPDSSLSNIISATIALNTIAPVAAFDVTPDSGIAGETLFTFDASSSEHPLGLLLRWDWDGDGQFDTDWSSNRTEHHQFRFGGGKKQVKLEVQDPSGWIATATATITVYSRPFPEFTYVQDPQNPLRITFDASGSGDYEDGNQLQFRWDFDSDSVWDSGWNQEHTIIHQFEPFASTYVTLEAKDRQGLTNRYVALVSNGFDDMIYIPAGEFVMGSDSFDIDERPVHRVFLNDFWIDRFPVTNQKYARFLNDYVQKYLDRSADIARFIDLSASGVKIRYEAGEYVVEPSYEDHPVTHVTWYGAEAYCHFYDKRLPTEAEWEKAARGPDQRLFPWGNEVDSLRANYWDSGDPYDNETTPVGFYNGRNHNGFQTNDSPGYYGTYDMGSNVKEWVSDWYLRTYYAESPAKDPTGPATGARKVVRGGGFLFHPEASRTTCRYSLPPDRSSAFIGFRCARSASK